MLLFRVNRNQLPLNISCKFRSLLTLFIFVSFITNYLAAVTRSLFVYKNVDRIMMSHCLCNCIYITNIAFTVNFIVTL